MGLTRNQVVIVAILLAGATLVVLNQTLLSPAYPSIMADLQADATTVQWLTSAYSLVEAIAIPLSAFLIGRFPTRKLFIAGVSVFALGSLMAAFSPFFGILLLGRIFQAAATGVVMPMVFTVILLIFPREKRGSAMGIVSLVIGFAPAVGPSLSGLLVESVGWRSLFMLVTALAVLIVVLAIVFLKSYGEFEPTSFDKPSVALCSLGLLGLLYGLATITSATNIAIPIALIVAGAILLTFFVRRQLRLEVPLLKVDVLKSRSGCLAPGRAGWHRRFAPHLFAKPARCICPRNRPYHAAWRCAGRHHGLLRWPPVRQAGCSPYRNPRRLGCGHRRLRLGWLWTRHARTLHHRYLHLPGRWHAGAGHPA